MGLEWDVTDFSSKELKVKVLFDTPLLISQAESKDILTLRFLKPWLFESVAQEAQIKEKELSINVPTQIPSDDAQGKNLKKAAENLEGGMKTGVILNFIVNLGLSGSL